MKRIERILVPIDFSEVSKSALDHAIAVARRSGAALELLHIWEGHSYAGGASFEHVGERGPQVSQGLIEFSGTEDGRQLEGWMNQARAAGVKVRARLESGDPAGAIVRSGSHGGYDMIVMGTHGRRGLTHLLLGSVAEYVLGHAPCPVLTIGRDGIPNRASSGSTAIAGGS